MTRVNGTIIEISDNGGELLLRATTERDLLPLPGQYFMFGCGSGEELLPFTVFPVRSGPDFIDFISISEFNWHIGQEVTFRGPLGQGFSIPIDATKVGLIGLTQKGALNLLPLAKRLLESGKEVALATDARLHGLPLDLEILPGEQALEVSIWADAAALAITRNQIAQSLDLFRIGYTKKPFEALILSEFPCGGMAGCGVCAVSTKKGWKNVCKDGPVFDLSELAAE